MKRMFEVSKELYDFLCLRLNSDGIRIIHSIYSHESFGSWLVELKEMRIVFDGKDSLLSYQAQQRRGWVNATSKKLPPVIPEGLAEILFGEIKAMCK